MHNFLSSPWCKVGSNNSLFIDIFLHHQDIDIVFISVPNQEEKLGLEDGSIPDESLSASSSWERQEGYTDVSTPGGGRLNKIPPDSSTIGAWHPRVADTNQ